MPTLIVWQGYKNALVTYMNQGRLNFYSYYIHNLIRGGGIAQLGDKKRFFCFIGPGGPKAYAFNIGMYPILLFTVIRYDTWFFSMVQLNRFQSNALQRIFFFEDSNMQGYRDKIMEDKSFLPQILSCKYLGKERYLE